LFNAAITTEAAIVEFDEPGRQGDEAQHCKAQGDRVGYRERGNDPQNLAESLTEGRDSLPSPVTALQNRREQQRAQKQDVIEKLAPERNRMTFELPGIASGLKTAVWVAVWPRLLRPRCTDYDDTAGTDRGDGCKGRSNNPSPKRLVSPIAAALNGRVRGVAPGCWWWGLPHAPDKAGPRQLQS
jgi:hypothetical protein